MSSTSAPPPTIPTQSTLLRSTGTRYTLQRVVFENGHCLLPGQPTLEDYRSILDDEVRAIAGKVVGVHDTTIPLKQTYGRLGADNRRKEQAPIQPEMTLRMENICGNFRGMFENVANAGALFRPDAIRVGEHVRHRQFVGTHISFHTVHGRLAYRPHTKMWGFKGCRSLQDLVRVVRDITEDEESDIYPVVNMLSVTLRTETALVINPAHSLMHRVIERLYPNIVKIAPRIDDTNNLFFMDVIGWKELLRVVEADKYRGIERTNDAHVQDIEVERVRTYLKNHSNDAAAHPTVSIGFTRTGVFFIRVTFPRGCICSVDGSIGVVDGVANTVSSTVCVGGLEPFVQVVVRWLLIVLVKMRVLGVQ